MPTDPVPTPPNLDYLVEEFGRARSWTMDIVAGLDERQVSWRPHENSSAIAWHLGHQAAVGHYMARNLTAAEPSFNTVYDRLFDSATQESERGELPSLDSIIRYRDAVAESTLTIMDRIDRGDVGAPDQLRLIAGGLLRAVINHEYQHDAWILEVRDTIGASVTPPSPSQNCAVVDGYFILT